MPELPEVEATRRLLIRHAQGRRITRVQHDEDDAKIFSPSPDRSTVHRAFAGRRVADVGRLGKHFYLVFEDTGPTPVMHLGMTGQVWVKVKGSGEVEGCEYARDVGNGNSNGGNGPAAWPPRFHKLLLDLDDGASIALCDARRFGRVHILDAGLDPLRSPPLNKLGFDALLALPPLPRFTQMLAARRSAKLKPLLLDQGFSAGVGNWVADEVLFQARLHPEQRVSDLLEVDGGEGGGRGGGGAGGHVARLHAALKDVVRQACDVDADSARFPEWWLFHARWTGGKSTTMPTAPGGSGGGGGRLRVEFLTSGGRTSAYVPALQRLVSAKGACGSDGSGGSKKKKKKGEEEEEEEEDEQKPRRPRAGKAAAAASAATKKQKRKEEEDDAEEEAKARPDAPRKRRAAAAAAPPRK